MQPGSAAQRNSFKYKVLQMYIIVRSFLHSIWIAVNNFIWTNKLFRRSRLRRKAVVIGDENAFGFGDWIICSQTPGIAKYLQAEIRSKEDARFQWSVFNAGSSGSTTDAWLPDAPQKGTFGKSLFDQNFGANGSHSDADVVIIFMGSNDTSQDPDQTGRNLIKISEELVKQGKRVWINTIPTKGYLGQGKAKLGWVLCERNQGIRKAHAALEKQNPTPMHVYMGVDVEPYKRTELFCFDEVHLSGKGYRRVAKELYATMKNPLVNIEWVVLRPQLEEKLKERGNHFMAAEVANMGAPPPKQ